MSANDTAHLDGYRAELERRATSWVLKQRVVSGGQSLSLHEIHAYPDTPSGMAEAMRAKIFLAALCRYLNTGGDMTDLDDLVATALTGTLNRSTISPDCKLVFTAEQANYTHIFEMPEGKFLRIVEDEYCEALTEQQIAELLEEGSVAPQSEPTDELSTSSVPAA